MAKNRENQESRYRANLIAGLWTYAQGIGLLQPAHPQTADRRLPYRFVDYFLLVDELILLSERLPLPDQDATDEPLLAEISGQLAHCRTEQLQELPPAELLAIVREAAGQFVGQR
jgi:hypothetical protein